ncbi:MAG: catalase, partial [Burkholderiales bacterium]|nr:catalase [Burkholderiales bacterium]
MKKSDTRSPSRNGAASKAASRSTAGRPSRPAPDGTGDALTQQAADVQTMVAGLPYNSNKSKEVGRNNAISPPEGLTTEPPSRQAVGSTLSEVNASDKTGQGPTPGTNATIGSLDRVRSDAAGQQLTTNQGVPIGDNQNSLKAGLRGPTLLEDFILREKITHFDHERIPERIVHARGSGAHGYFECTAPLTRHTRAAPLQQAGKITPVFVRFSTVAGERGSKDTARDVRG